jgi:flagellar hook-associated protein 3 FlgL
MRISTSGMHANALTAMLTQQATLSKTQNQIATGRRVQTPADDPVAAVHILELERALQASEQYSTNANMAINRLSLEEDALDDVTTLLQRVRELTIQGNSATIDDASRRILATEIRGRLQELIDIANRQDAGGEFLFSGYSTRTRPFEASGASVSYFGDQHNRQLEIGPNQRVTDSHAGYDVFIGVREGNGTFVVDAAAGNTGTAVAGSGAVVNPAAWVAGDYRVQFTTANAWQVLDSGNAVVASGAYAGETGSVSFNGVNVTITGAPAAGDEFAISQSRTEDIFTSLQRLITSLETPIASAADRARRATDMGRTLQQLDQANDHLAGVRAQVGARLSAIDAANEARADQKVELQRMASELRDLDYAEAIARMNQQLVGLEAAQASYSRISQLSLFDYLR